MLHPLGYIAAGRGGPNCSGLYLDPVECRHCEDVDVIDDILLVPASMQDHVEARIIRSGTQSGACSGPGTWDVSRGEYGEPIFRGDVVDLDTVHLPELGDLLGGGFRQETSNRH